MLQVTNIRTTINTQVYFMPWARCRPLSCLLPTDLTTVTAWLSLVGFCLFFFSGSSKRREVMFFTAEHANRTSSSSDSLGGRTGRARREGGSTGRAGRDDMKGGGRTEREHFRASIFRSKYYASRGLWCHFTMEWHRHTSSAQLRQYITIYRTYSEGTLHMSGQVLLSIRKERK